MLPAKITKNMLAQQERFNAELEALRRAIENNAKVEDPENKQYVSDKLDEIREVLSRGDFKELNDKLDALNEEIRSLDRVSGAGYQDMRPVSIFDVRPNKRDNIRYLVRLFNEAQRMEATPDSADRANKATQKVAEQVKLTKEDVSVS